eukprot:247098_1
MYRFPSTMILIIFFTINTITFRTSYGTEYAYAPMINIVSRDQVSIACPGWNSYDNINACTKLSCYSPTISPTCRPTTNNPTSQPTGVTTTSQPTTTNPTDSNEWLHMILFIFIILRISTLISQNFKIHMVLVLVSLHFGSSSSIDISTIASEKTFNELVVGNRVVIESINGGYLTDMKSGRTITSSSSFTSAQIWKVTDNYIAGQIQFRNEVTNLYLKNDGRPPCVVGVIDGAGRAGSWKQVVAGTFESYHGCCCTESSSDTVINIANSCNAGCAQYIFHVLHTTDPTLNPSNNPTNKPTTSPSGRPTYDTTASPTKSPTETLLATIYSRGNSQQGGYSYISVDPDEFYWQGGRGFNIVVMDEYGGLVNTATFDTYNRPNNDDAAVVYLNAIASGHLLIITVFDTASVNSQTLGTLAVLNSWGCNVNDLNFREPFIFIGIAQQSTINCMKSDANGPTILESFEIERGSLRHITPNPTKYPTKYPTKKPTKNPIKTPTKAPSYSPTENPTSAPTQNPASAPTKTPTQYPTKYPTDLPTTAYDTTAYDTTEYDTTAHDTTAHDTTAYDTTAYGTIGQIFNPT